MTAVDSASVARLVSDALGLRVKTRRTGNGSEIGIRVAGLDRPNGFEVLLRVQLESVYSELAFDNLARPLVELIDQASDSSWDQFDSQLDALLAAGVRVNVLVNGSDYERSSYPSVSDISFSARQVNWVGSLVASAASLASSLLALALSLIPLKETPLAASEADTSDAGSDAYAMEGRKYQGIYTRYERSRSNRAIAIVVHGTKCAVCQFNFEIAFGDIGAGYVEIHHKTPVHLMLEERVVDPVEELVPLCSNCHRMVHTQDPPIPISDLRDLVHQRREGKDSI
jgi:hypothetical protein